MEDTIIWKFSFVEPESICNTVDLRLKGYFEKNFEVKKVLKWGFEKAFKGSANFKGIFRTVPIIYVGVRLLSIDRRRLAGS